MRSALEAAIVGKKQEFGLKSKKHASLCSDFAIQMRGLVIRNPS